MRTQDRVPNRWLIAAACTVLQLCLGTVYAWSYFQPLLVEQFRWSNTDTSWAFSLNICCLGLSAAWGGQSCQDRTTQAGRRRRHSLRGGLRHSSARARGEESPAFLSGLWRRQWDRHRLGL